MLKNIVGVGVILILTLMFSACGGGGGGSSDVESTGASSSDSSSANCDGVTTDSNNCYLGYIGLSDNDKVCCDTWIAQQQK